MGKINTTLVALPSLKFILPILIAVFLKRSIAIDTLTVSNPLSVGQTLVSSGNRFELGFFRPGNSSKLYIGIWFKEIPWRRPVWVANREHPLQASDTASALAIEFDGNLVLLNGTRNTVWSTNVSSQLNGTVAVLSDNGDLILKDNVSGSMLWQSFDHPCDTFIAGMRIGTNDRTGERLVLTSWKTEDDPSVGDFVLGLTTERPMQYFVWKGPFGSEPYWRSGPWNGWACIGFHGTHGGYSNGFVIEQDNRQGSVYATYHPPSVSEVIVELLTPDGNVNPRHYDIQNIGVVDSRVAIETPCDVYGVCGPFGFYDSPKSTCKCLEGFFPKSEEEW